MIRNKCLMILMLMVSAFCLTNDVFAARGGGGHRGGGRHHGGHGHHNGGHHRGGYHRGYGYGRGGYGYGRGGWGYGAGLGVGLGTAALVGTAAAAGSRGDYYENNYYQNTPQDELYEDQEVAMPME